MAKITTCLFIIVLSYSCTTNSELEENLNTDLLINCWTHSMEEDPDSKTQVYRQCQSREFPDSRFRMFMDLKSDGSCEYLELSPVDAHQSVKGSWIFDQDTEEFSILNNTGKAVFESKITNVEADRITFSL